MNTLTENELAVIAAAGDPTASWPATPYVPSLPVWPGVVGGRNPLEPRATDS